MSCISGSLKPRTHRALAMCPPAFWRANTRGPALTWPESDGPLFLTNDGSDAQDPRVILCGHQTDAVPPWAVNELPDQGIETLIDLIILIEQKCEWPNLRKRIIFTAKAAGGVRHIGLLFSIVRLQCTLRRIEAKVWEASNTEGFLWATHERDVERCVWEQAG